MEKELETIFLKAIEANKDKIFRFCRHYSTDADDARDLFQEVLLNSWKSLPSFKYQSSIDTWLYRITINICLRAKKYSDQKQRRFVKLESISIENIAEKDITEEKEILFNRLSECIKMLEGVDKSIILLHLEGLPYKDIARISGLTENHVAVKIKRIKNRLQTSLKPLNNYGK